LGTNTPAQGGGFLGLLVLPLCPVWCYDSRVKVLFVVPGLVALILTVFASLDLVFSPQHAQSATLYMDLPAQRKGTNSFLVSGPAPQQMAVYRNGLRQKLCSPVSSPCDYAALWSNGSMVIQFLQPVPTDDMVIVDVWR
jgi:hypothetical protein